MSTDKPPYLDTDRSIDRRVDDLVSRMTLEERIGQLAGTTIGLRNVADSVDGLKKTALEANLGGISPLGWQEHTPREMAEVVNEIQEHVVENSRLGVPLLVYADADHGHAYCTGATVFPHNMGLAATWDTSLVERVADVTATELRRTGVHQNLNPVCDVGREPRWGRVFETFGESPRLCAEMAAAKVRGYQGERRFGADSAVATAKHFPAYSEPERGEDGAPVDVSEYTLRRAFLPPFRAAIEADVGSVMPCYNDVNGEPVHGSEYFLTDLLRGELGFDGLVVSDWFGVEMLSRDHGTAHSVEEATQQVTDAGLDFASMGGPEHVSHVQTLLDDGELSDERVDRSVRRVLRLKFELGLFADPYVDPTHAAGTLGSADHRKLARDCARDSLTLVQNDNDTLPFDPDVGSVLVGGPNADSLDHQLGGWSTVTDGTPGITLLDGIREVVSDSTDIRYEQGVSITEEVDIDAARRAASDADVAVLAVGENAYLHEFGNTPPEEFPKRTQLGLPAAQRRLVEAVQETGTPTALVLITGRPLAIERCVETVPAVLFSIYPGTEGGPAIAETLFGMANPGGALPISVPRSAGHLPTRHDYRPHPVPVEDAGMSTPDSYDPLFAFGHGLSYTSFEYRDMQVVPDETGPEGTVEVGVDVENVGDRDGDEVVQAYANDRVSSRVTPDRELVGFDRVTVPAGDRRHVSLTVDVGSLGVVDPDGQTVTEPGTFDVFVDDLAATFEVTSRW